MRGFTEEEWLEKLQDFVGSYRCCRSADSTNYRLFARGLLSNIQAEGGRVDDVDDLLARHLPGLLEKYVPSAVRGPKCFGTTRDGRPCRLPGSTYYGGFCRQHKRQYEALRIKQMEEDAWRIRNLSRAGTEGVESSNASGSVTTPVKLMPSQPVKSPSTLERVAMMYIKPEPVESRAPPPEPPLPAWRRTQPTWDEPGGDLPAVRPEDEEDFDWSLEPNPLASSSSSVASYVSESDI